ncbi:MAG: tetratricopeptide repeat protein [bacterium]|nr:tetratricopeptide repeat protein [bacterium]MDI1336029.1 tetratricopeptide repeat protein [Lacunisphaera sp.]
MKKFAPPASHPVPERTKTPFPSLRQLTWRDLKSFHWRHAWWHLLDHWDTRRGLRRFAYSLFAGLVLLGALVLWGYPEWNKRNAVRVARAWLASGHLRYAAEAAQRAAELAPENPEPWQIAAELARLGGQKDKALEYTRRAAELAPTNPEVLTGWAADALRADQIDEAYRALDKIPVEAQAQSAHIQRLKGEMSRRQSRLTAAKGYFEAAQRLEGPLAVNEVPLGLILLQSTAPTVRQSGLELLVKWTADREWGATALRTLLADALSRDDRPALRKWADALYRHPRHLRGDIPQCLLALARSDEARLAEVLAQLERDHAVSPAAAVQLLSWLNQIGQAAEAVRWMKTLPAAALHRPPLAAAAAESLRLTADWTALADWTRDGDWGPEAEFLRWTYGLQAARQLGDANRADELWRTLFSHAQLDSAHALFAAANIYSWGLVKEAEALWWRVGEQEGPNAIEALGTLARYYQTGRDAEGQYRVFRQLHLLKPTDHAIGNNFAFFAALTGRDQSPGEKVARANLAREPQNQAYVATLAFTLLQLGRTNEAASLLKPKAREAANSPALCFAYGLTLARSGRRDEARQLLKTIPPDSITSLELQLIRTALGD